MKAHIRTIILGAALSVVTLVAGAESMPVAAATADGGIVVSSMTVNHGQQGVVIPILLTNSFNLRGVVLPLQIRQLDSGAFITSLKLSFGDRLPFDGVLKDIKFNNQYLSSDGECMGRKAGGFGTIAARDSLPHNIPGSPVGVLFSRQRLVNADLPAGADSTGSFLLTVDIGKTAGRFEIDTTCTDPSNHILLIKSDVSPVIPSFTKGTITIK